MEDQSLERVQDDDVHVRVEFKAKNNKLLAERERRGLNQIEMAQELGVNAYSYGKAERFEKVSANLLEKIAAGLRMDPAVLFPEWAQEYGFVLNAGKKYFLISDEVAQAVIDTRGEPTMQKLLRESFVTDVNVLIAEVVSKWSRSPGRDAYIVRAYFGIGERRLSLEEIADKCRLTRERVRQIVNRAVRYLRHHKRADKLKQYIGEEFG